MDKNTTNQDKYPNFDKIENDAGFKRALMKQLERIENTNRAILEVLVEQAPAKKQDGLRYKLADILDDGQLNGSVEE